MKLVSHTLPCLLILIALVMPAQAQETGELAGTVFDFVSAPMPDAVIRIVVDGQTREVTTGADGTYSTTLPAGTHSVALVVQRQPITSVDVEITAGGNVEGNFDLGAMSEEDKAAALEMLEDRGNAEAVRAAFDLGRAALAAGDAEEAVAQFTLAVENDDQHLILANLAQAQAAAGLHADAAETYGRALIQDPINAVYLQNRGISLGNSGDVEGAVDSISQAAALDPLTAGSGYFNLGIIFINIGRTNEAVEAFTQALAADDSIAQAYYQLGLALVGTDAPAAIEPLERFIELEPDDPNAVTAQALVDFARTQ
jgi:Flp pilus assembly protein TadD